MKTRTTLALVVSAAALCAFIFLVERNSSRTGDANKPGRIFPGLKPAAVTEARVQPAGQLEILSVRTNAGWEITQPINYPAQPANVEALLQALAVVKWHSRLTATELRAHPQADKEFGFATPQFSVNLLQDGRVLQILIGALTPLRDEVFVKAAGEDEIYLADAQLVRFIPRTADDWRDPLLLNLKHLMFNRLTVTNGGKSFELQRDGGGKSWQLVRPLDARADSARIESLLQKLADLRVSKFVTDDPKADLESFGLQPPESEISFVQDANVVVSLQLGKSPTNDASQIYVRRPGQTGISLVAKDELAPWRGQFDDFRDRHLVALAANSVDEIEVRGAEDFTLRRQSNDVWRVTRPADFPADAALVNDLLASLGGMEVVQFVKSVATEPDLPGYGLAAPSRRFILRTRAGDTNAALVQLDFGATLDGKVFVKRADETAVSAVKLGDFQNLPDSGWKLRDRRIWNFTENDVTRLVVRQAGRMRELLRSGTNQWSFAPGSQGVINNFAVEEVVHRLGGLSAVAWTERGAQNRAAYGFTNNSLALDVKRGEKTETLTLELGGVSATQLQYGAATLDGQAWIFLLPPQIQELVRAYLTIPANP